jgi:hypothetical protein
VNGPLVTIGVPAYRGGDHLPLTLECLRTQTYPHLDILISVDAADTATARSCEPFLQSDPRFRMTIQPSRLGWAGNTDWTMRARRGEYYVFQQHDDQISPTYVADLVAAAIRVPNAAICFAQVRSNGVRNFVSSGFPLSGSSPVERVCAYLETLDCVPFRGLTRSSALATTSGLLLSDFDPFDSYGTENRYMAQLALWGDFVYVPGPLYYQRLHGENLHLKRASWSDEKRLISWALLAAWMIEVVTPAGPSTKERWQLFDLVLDRFIVPRAPWGWVRAPGRLISGTTAGALSPFRSLLAWIKRNETIVHAIIGRWMLFEAADQLQRAALLRSIFRLLREGGRFDPSGCLHSSWEQIESEAFKRFAKEERART